MARTKQIWMLVISALIGFSVGVLLRAQCRMHVNGSASPIQVATISSSSGPLLLPDSCPSITSSNFDQIYKRGAWGAQMQTIEKFYSNAKWPPRARKSASGPGSDLGYATQTSLQVLREEIKRRNITTMIDLPCGDANWIFDSWETDSLELYIGLDIVNQVIELNSKRLFHHSNKVFRRWDGTKCPLPEFQVSPNAPLRSVDLVHSRDVLQHLSQKQGIQFLCNVFKSGARVFVTTTFPGGKNKEISEGNYFRNDLTKAPYDLPNNATNCVPSHPKHEPDLTCVFDLTEPWTKDWIAQKCP